MALELLTGPSLLILDEPTSGLDPALDRQVMMMLRQLADAGRVVLVVTHSVSYLDVCDQILLVAPGGKTAFLGPPSQIGAAMGTTNWADIFAKVGADPDEANRRFLAENKQPPPPAPSEHSPAADLGEPVHTDLLRQFSTIARRQVRLVISDRGYTVFLALLPFLIGVLSLTVRGKTGLRHGGPVSNSPNQPGQILVMLNVGAVFMGTALTIRDLIGERPIFRREQAVGLSTWAYMFAKIAGVLRVRDHAGRDRDHDLGHRLGYTALRRRALGQCRLRAVRHRRRDLCGLGAARHGPVGGRPIPRSDHAAAGGVHHVAAGVLRRDDLGDRPDRARPVVVGHAGPVGLRGVGVDDRHRPPDSGPDDPKDQPLEAQPRHWLFDMAMLAVLCLFYSGIVWWKIRLKRH